MSQAEEAVGSTGAPTELDLLVLGSGVAGLSAAVQAATGPGVRVGVLTKGELSQTATRWAQGGVAAVIGGDPDSTDLHLADTLAAGAGLCDVDAVRVLVDEGPVRVQNLIALGAVFDRDAGGRLALAREGGHSVARVVHAGGAATGAEIERALVDAVHATAASVMERWFAVELLVDAGRCGGVVAVDPSGVRHEVRARHTLLATGGAGQLFAVTTNPEQATGDGVAMALRAGVAVADLEFVQFHPTALHHPQVPRPLLSEALRGHGALIRDSHGERFVDELAPRDVVSRAMTRRMLEEGVDHLWLDATGLESFAERFPTIAAAVGAAGLDPSAEWLPIAPAAHYAIGGVVTDLDGATTLPGLWAAGEVACTGVHGANRLGSNSLLEGMVFAARVVEAIDRGVSQPSPAGMMAAMLEGSAQVIEVTFGDAAATAGTADTAIAPDADPAVCSDGYHDPAKRLETLQQAMTRGAGVLRDAASLARVAATLDRSGVISDYQGDPERHQNEMTVVGYEIGNLLDAARATVAAAAFREESRGAHTRTDFPNRRPEFERHIVTRFSAGPQSPPLGERS